MSEFPSYITFMPIVILVAGLGFYFYRIKVMKGYDQQYSNYRAGELAQRLGLTLVEGDPTFNLYITHAHADIIRGPADGKPIHIQIRMNGSPGGLPLELVYFYRLEQDTDISTVTWRTWFDCRMSVQARQAFPPFEVLTRNPPMGPIVQKQPLPAHPTGNPAIDSIYLVATNEPNMAQLLGTVLPGFATFANSGIHLVGDGQNVDFVMQRDKAPLLPNALYYAETMVQQLTAVAKAVGG